MSRSCTTCQHLKRPEIDRRLAAGEPSAQVARDYDLNTSSLHRHRVNCLKLAASGAIKKAAARGTAAVAMLPSKETLSASYFDLISRIDQIVAEAQQQQSLRLALSGLTGVRQTLDSLTRLVGHDGAPAAGTDKSAAPQQPAWDVAAIAERLQREFDQQPEIKARIAKTLLEACHEQAA